MIDRGDKTKINNLKSRNGSSGRSFDLKSSFKGALPQLPVIRWNKGQSTGVLECQRALYTQVTREEGEIGTMFMEGKKPSYPTQKQSQEFIDEFEAEAKEWDDSFTREKERYASDYELAESNGPGELADFTHQNPQPKKEKFDRHGLKMKRLESDIKVAIDWERDIKRKKRPVYATIWGQLDPDSIAEIRKHQDFDRAETEGCPLTLWNIIMKTHVTEIAGTGADNAATLLEQYNTVYQSRQESLVDFRQRFDQACTRMVAAGATEPKEDLKAVQFMRKLDRGRYTGYVEAIDTSVAISAGKVKAPDTVDQVQEGATAYERFRLKSKRPEDREKPTGHQVFFVHNEKGKSSKGKEAMSKFKNNKKPEKSKDKGDKRGHDKGSNDQEQTSKKLKSNQDRPGPKCKFCHEIGHWIQDCARLEASSAKLRKLDEELQNEE